MDKKKPPVKKGMGCSSADPTGSAQTGEIVALSEERYRNILENMQDSYIEVDMAGNFTFINEALCQNVGYTSDELIGKNYSIIAPGDEEIREVFAAYNEVYKTGEPHKGFAFKVLRKDGTTGYGETSISLIKDGQGRTVGFRSVGRDVTERKQMEETLLLSEERYRSILDQMYDVYYEVDLAGNFTFVNEATCSKLGYAQAEMIGKSYRLAVPEYDIDKLFAASKAVFKSGKPNKSFSHSILHKDGSLMEAESFIDLRRNKQGEIIGFRTVSRDISKRKKAEAAMVESEKKYRNLFDNMSSAFSLHEIITDNSGRPVDYVFLAVNPLFEKMTGLQQKDIVGKRVTEVLPGTEKDPADWIGTYGKVALSGEPISFEQYSEVLDKWYSIVAYSPTARQFATVFADITEHKKTEDALKKSEVRYRELITNLDAGVVVHAPDTTIIMNNPRASELLGLSDDQMKGKLAIDPQWKFINESTAPLPIKEYPVNQIAGSQKPLKNQTVGVCRPLTNDITWLMVNGFPVLDSKGEISEIIISFIDITERKRAEAEIESARDQYQSLVNNIPGIVYRCKLDRDWTMLYMSDAVDPLSGYPTSDFIQNAVRTYESVIHPDDTDYVAQSVNTAVAEERSWDIEYRICHKDGDIRWVHEKGRGVPGEDGGVSYLDGFILEITDRKLSEETLRESEKRFDLALEGTGAGVWDWDMVKDQVVYSIQWKRMLGYDDHEVENSFAGWKNLWHPDDCADIEKTMQDYLAGITGHYEIVHRLRHKDGGWRWIVTRGDILKDKQGKPCRWVGTNIDISDQKLAEAALQESEDKYRTLFNSAGQGIGIVQDGMFKFVNTKLVQLLGYTEEEILSTSIAEFIHPQDRELVMERYMRRLSGEIVENVYQFRYINKSHDTRWVEITTVLIEWEGKPATLDYYSDVTRSKQVEEALARREQSYSTLVENIPDMIVRFDTGLRYVFCNMAVERQLGVPGDVFIGKTPLEIAGPDEQAQFVYKALRNALDTGEAKQVKQSFQLPAGTKIFQTRILPEHDGSGKIVSLLAVSSDITDRKRLEEEQQRVDKLEAVGLLAGGIAHDFNNILTAILGNVSLAGMEATPGSELQNSLEQAEKAALRAKALTVQLLTFSKGGAPILKLASLTELLKDTAGFALSGSNVKCKFSIPAGLWHAEIDAGQVSQVVHNLVINAQQAMPAGGSIEISAENMALSKTQSLGKGLPLDTGDYVRIAVTDHGTGIPADHLEKIFDPFFTTKQKGNGMGLAVSFSIARQHGGHISVESELGTGSTFYLYLPASVQISTPKEDKKEAVKPAGKARILVMDDEKGVREIVGRMLKHIGYKDIEFAEDGAEAIKLYKAAMKSGHPFNVAILDLTIAGGMGGEIAIQKLLKIDPGVKAIVSSGYIDDPVIAKYKDHGFSGVVAKPYTIAELRKAVQDVMG